MTARTLKRGGRVGGGMEDDTYWCGLGTVALHDGETGHYEVNDDGDIQVTVVMHKHGSPVTAVLGGSFGSAAGAWVIPAAGDEVMVAFADGEFEGDAIVVAVTSSRSAPAGLAPGVVLLKADTRVQADAPEVLLGGGVGHETTIKADTYRGAESSLHSAMTTYLGALATYIVIPVPTAPQTATYTAANAALIAAINSFEGGAAGFKTTVTKVK